jgi:hypothetical protein
VRRRERSRSGEEDETETDSGAGGVQEPTRPRSFPKAGEHQQGESEAVSHLVGVGRDVVVVSRPDELGEGEETDESEQSQGGRQAIGHCSEKPVEKRRHPCQNQQIPEAQGAEADPKASKPDRVQVGGEGTVGIGEITVQDLARGEAPGELEFPAEIDEHVRPLSLGPDEKPEKADGDEEGSPTRSDAEFVFGLPVPPHRDKSIPHGGARRSAPPSCRQTTKPGNPDGRQ